MFEEVQAFPLERGEIDEVLTGVRGLLENGIDDLLVFSMREIGRSERRSGRLRQESSSHLQDKYRSASSIVSSNVNDLRDLLMRQDICMIFMLVEAPEDRLMAYQHVKRSSFVTRQGIDKLFGARVAAERLGVDLQCVRRLRGYADGFVPGWCWPRCPRRPPRLGT